MTTVTTLAAALGGCGPRSGPVFDAVIVATPPPQTVPFDQPVSNNWVAPTTSTTLAPTTTTLAPTTTTPPTTLPPATTPPTTTRPPTTTAVYHTPAPVVADPTSPRNPDVQEPVTIVGRIRIAKLKIDSNIYDGVSNVILNLGPGHWPGTGWPGQVGNFVVGGHRTSHHRIFRNIDQLVPGDQILIDGSGGTFTYKVRETKIVDKTDTWISDPTTTATITLFACHPPGSTSHRIVVTGDLVS